MAKKLEPTMLVGRVDNLAANTQTEIQINTGGFDLFLWGIVADHTGAFRMNFTPSDTNRQYASDLVPDTMITGTGIDPFRVDREGNPRMLFVRRNTTISVQVLDTSGANNTIVLGFLGFRR